MSRDTESRKRTQKTQPKKGKPVDIPVPKRREFERLLDRAAKGSDPKRQNPEG